MLGIILAALAALTVGAVPLAPADILDGRAIAGGDGKPVVMLTLTPAAVARLPKVDVPVNIDGYAAAVRRAGNTIEIDGQPDFAAATALALRLSGKPPLPDTTDE